MGSRKYFVGESYGGFRGPRMTHYLQTQLGVAMNGVVLVSPYLNPAADEQGDLSPLPWMLTLPSITAAHFERRAVEECRMQNNIGILNGKAIR